MKPPQSRPIYSHIAADFIFFLPRNLLRVAAIKNVFAFHFLSLNKCAASIRRLSHHRAIRPSFPVRIRLPPWPLIIYSAPQTCSAILSLFLFLVFSWRRASRRADRRRKATKGRPFGSACWKNLAVPTDLCAISLLCLVLRNSIPSSGSQLMRQI